MTRSLPVIQPSSLIPEGRKPAWLKVRAPGGPNYMRLKSRMREWNLHSVCEEARCPNIGECWEDATATFMILGDVCTRNCGYCAIAHGTPVWEDREEPERIGRAVRELGLEYVVITSVNRDDLADGGAARWAATVRAVRRHAPRCRVEVLIPDFQGDAAALATVIDAAPDILNHNTETVPRLYRVARHGGRHGRAPQLFLRAPATAPPPPTKSGLILRLREERDELLATMPDLLQGDAAALATVIDAAPDILNHNTETVPRLYRVARHGGRYERALELFRRARATAPALPTKSGIILGLGEERDELLATMRDLVEVGVAILALGQYLRPSAQHLPVARYYRPEEFAELAEAGRALGFAHVEAGPLVGASDHPEEEGDAGGAAGQWENSPHL